ncbi:hypothetical protein KC734_07860 [candidate division KSB1 bacterium]|nr:hypothetical protein [candidate division KSB1 bacterium]
MDTIIKILVGGAVVFLVFGGPRLLNKDGGQAQQPPPVVIEDPTPGGGDSGQPQPQPPAPVDLSRTFANGAPTNRISSRNWLEKNGRLTIEMQEANLTYYMLANSSRGHIDSVAACLKREVQQRNIDPTEFQYNYFLDRVNMSGSGLLIWEGKSYITSYDRIRSAGWNNIPWSYTCGRFTFAPRNALSFIRNNINNENVFTPQSKARYPYGATASSQGAVNWVSISINPRDIPMSVPLESRRSQLAARFENEGKRKPVPRSFVVIQTKDGTLYLTEAMDTGSGVKPGWIDWRIGNNSTEINFFRSIGPTVKAYCYTFDDPNITYQQVIQNSR